MNWTVPLGEMGVQVFTRSIFCARHANCDQGHDQTRTHLLGERARSHPRSPRGGRPFHSHPTLRPSLASHLITTYKDTSFHRRLPCRRPPPSDRTSQTDRADHHLPPRPGTNRSPQAVGPLTPLSLSHPHSDTSAPQVIKDGVPGSTSSYHDGSAWRGATWGYTGGKQDAEPKQAGVEPDRPELAWNEAFLPLSFNPCDNEKSRQLSKWGIEARSDLKLKPSQRGPARSSKTGDVSGLRKVDGMIKERGHTFLTTSTTFA